jgi:hypothetical protein
VALQRGSTTPLDTYSAAWRSVASGQAIVTVTNGLTRVTTMDRRQRPLSNAALATPSPLLCSRRPGGYPSSNTANG